MLNISSNEYIAKKTEMKVGKVIVLALLFVLLLGVNHAYVYNTSLTPFGIGIVFALALFKFNGYILSIIYVLACIYPWSLGALLQGCNVALILCFVEYLSKKGKLKLNKYNVVIFVLLSMIAFVVLGVTSGVNIIAVGVAVILGSFFVYSCACFFDATIGRGMNGVINLDEKICGAVILIIFSIGLADVYVGIVNMGLLICMLIILLVSLQYNASTTLVCSVLVGLGFGLVGHNGILISMFVCIALSVIAFKCSWRILSGVASVLSYVSFCLWFDVGVSLGEIVSISAGALIFICIPSKFLLASKNIWTTTRPVAIENIFNGTKQEVVARVKELSRVFDQMNTVYRQMIKGKLPDAEAKLMLRDELIDNVCSRCDNVDRCFRNRGSFMSDCFDRLISIGYSKHKISLVDLPEYLTTNCYYVNSIVQCYNNLLTAYYEYDQSVSNIDTSRVLLADQLSGVSTLLESLSKEISTNITLDNRYGNLIKEHLGYVGINCAECVVYQKSSVCSKISLIVLNNVIDDKKILKIVNKCMKGKYRIDKVDKMDSVGASSVMLVSAPKYDIAFGSSVVTKSGKIVSGDNYAIVPVGEGKFLVSICDGMGSGNSARDISSLTIKLIENFYRAGFDNDIILSSVNKLLSLNEQEKFSTIDLCLIDCRNSLYDFIKLGASVGVVKRSSGDIEVIESSGLPVGVLENICPHITKLYINPMDIIVMVSDGVSDIMGDDLIDFVKFADVINPQELSNLILKEAVDRSDGVARDDMTVLCVRVFEI